MNARKETPTATGSLGYGVLAAPRGAKPCRAGSYQRSRQSTGLTARPWVAVEGALPLADVVGLGSIVGLLV